MQGCRQTEELEFMVSEFSKMICCLTEGFSLFLVPPNHITKSVMGEGLNLLPLPSWIFHFARGFSAKNCFKEVRTVIDIRDHPT